MFPLIDSQLADEKNKKKISKELSIIFKNTKKNMFNNQKMTGDDTGQSFYSGEYFEFLTGPIAWVAAASPPRRGLRM